MGWETVDFGATSGTRLSVIFGHLGADSCWQNGTAGSLPWGFLTLSAALHLVFNFLINFGIAFTSPLFISLGPHCDSPVFFKTLEMHNSPLISAFCYKNSSIGPQK